MAFDLASVLKDVSNSGTKRKQIEYIRLDLIDEDELNFYALSDIEKLANNIATIDLQQPLVLRPSLKSPGRYIVVSGHRRRAALNLLVQEDPERWSEVPCIVDSEAVSPYLQELALIFGNNDNRKMSNADLDKQAQRVEEILYKLKEEGYEFPGRMRDHVSQAVGASKSKLARLKVIRENLAACWVDAWKNGTIGESVAYNLSQLPKPWQTIIHTVWGDKPDMLYADTVHNAKWRFQKVSELQCKHGLNFCEHSVMMMQKNCKEMYYAPCTGCCFDCSSLQTCKNCCPEAKTKKAELKATAKQASVEVAEREAKRAQPYIDMARLVYERVGIARDRNRVSVEQLYKAQKRFYNASTDDKRQKDYERGVGTFSDNTDLPFGYSVRASLLITIRDVADALGCSVDYLLGRTDDRQSHLSQLPQEESVSNSGTTWQTGEPTEAGSYILLLGFECSCYQSVEQWDWDGEKGWCDDTILLDLEDGTRVLGWIPMPQAKEGI